MCDCYEHPCLACGREIPMHIGDYAVGRDEIAILHGKCLEGWIATPLICPGKPRPATYVLWEIDEIDEAQSRVSGLVAGDQIAVVPLTIDAVNCHEDNHPNVLDCHIVVRAGVAP